MGTCDMMKIEKVQVIEK